MSYNIYTFFIFYFIIIFSVVGYGLFISNIVNLLDIRKNFGYSGLLGLFFLTIYSYISNFFLPHNLVHNTILVLIGIFFYLYFLRKKIFKIKETLLFVLIFLLLFISILMFKTHDDFPYYHFAYSYYLTQNSSIIGIGPFNHGFRTPSSIFYLNSLFYLPVVKYFMFHMPALLILGFSNIIFLKKILKNIKFKSINFITFFCLLSFLFVNIFFYRIAEHGTDRSAQILVFILLIEIMILINFKINNHIQLTKIYILVSLIISFKVFYLMYLAFFIPLIFFYYQKDNFLNIFKIIQNQFFIYFVILILLVVATNFFNSGCLLYPASITCFENLPWAFDLNLVVQMNDWYEQWSKAGAGPNFRIEDPQEYIRYLNWVPNWLEMYFFNKVSDLLGGILLLCIIVFLIFNSKIKTKNKHYKISFIYFILLILFIEWFYNHPSLRYGGYCLIASIIFLPISILLEKNLNLNDKNLKNKFLFLILCGIIIFIGRNLKRINEEYKIYEYKPLKETFYNIEERYFSTQKEFNKLINNFNLCETKKNECSAELEPKTIKLYGKYIFINNQ
jgi:hypothetical protein